MSGLSLGAFGDGPLYLGAAIVRPLGLGIGLWIGIVPSYGAIAMG